ncbi:MAG: aminotransferase class V-fold PLP-dependent enzyme [Clostridia bacterium]|nr:aminotransferase class V-fold PLP-dependent enzyme [Clostridia bacterium]
MQAFGKIPVPAGRSGIDLLSVSGHKIHAPKGVGALYIRRGVRLHPRMLGGGQENGMRSGTEALPAIAAMGAAVCALPAYDVQQERFSRLYAALLDRLAPELAAGQIVLHRPAAGVRYIVSLSVPGYRSETLLHALAARNVFVSSGSACARGKRSAVLSAMGVPDREIDAALRLSFCADNTGQDVDAFVQALREAMKTVARKRG